MMCEHGGEHFSWHFVCNKCGMPGSDAILETALAAANARAELAERQLEETRNVRNALFISLEAANARIAELEATLNQHDEISERLARKFIEKAQEQQQVAISRAEQAEASCAAMRELLADILPLAKFESCCYFADDDANQTTHCCDWNGIVDEINAALSASSSISTDIV